MGDHVPRYPIVGQERMRRLHLGVYIGFALEYSVACAALALGGVLDEFPNLRFCFFEAGAGWLPYTMMGADRSFYIQNACSRTRTPPSELIKKVRQQPFIVLTGLSGSGKSQAIRALEDLGYFCVDNLPVALLPMFAELTLRAGSEMARAAVVVDVREGKMLDELPGTYRSLKSIGNLNPVLIFLDASDDVLVRRFSETRRPHPLAPNRSAIEGIREERERMKPIRRLADHVVDTSAMTVHELRHAFRDVQTGRAPGAQLVVTILSFGFKHGIPVDSDLLFDVRFLPNPHFVPEFRSLTGRHPKVARYIRSFPQTREFIERISELLVYLLPHYIREGKSYLTVAFGCTGGQHRSVMIAEDVAKRLARAGYRIKAQHRDSPK